MDNRPNMTNGCHTTPTVNRWCRSLRALATFSTCSGLFFFPLREFLIFSMVSGGRGPFFFPLLPAASFSLCSAVLGDLRGFLSFCLCSSVKGLPEVPSPPSVRLCNIPVLKSFLPYHLIILLSMAHAPISVRFTSRNTISDLFLGTDECPLCLTNALGPLPLPI